MAAGDSTSRRGCLITPTKGIAPDRSLLALGVQIALQLDQPRTVSQGLVAVAAVA